MLDDLIELAKLAKESGKDDLALAIYEAALEQAPVYGFDEGDLFSTIFDE